MTETSFVTFVLGLVGGSIIGLIVAAWLIEKWGIYRFLDATLGKLLDRLGL